MKPIYLDYAATTPVDPRVAEKMQQCLNLDGVFGNPSSQHFYGIEAKKMVDEAREKVAALIHAEPRDLIWTSGATESNNLALKGAAHLYQRKGKHIITVKTEHKAVLDSCHYLEKQGYFVTYLSVLPNGKLDMNHLRDAISEDTILISVMQVNNETGVIQDINAIAEMTASRGILFHVDAAQSAGKIPIDVSKTPVDLMSFSAHKVYGPKGMGALYLRKKPRVRVEAQMHGGGHEQGMRSGTLATHQIVGMGEAFSIAAEVMEEESKRIHYLRSLFLEKLASIKIISINADPNYCVPHILNLQFQGISAESLLKKCKDLAVSTASACLEKGTEPSYVLRALGLNHVQAKSSLRFSFGRFTTEEEIEHAVILLKEFCL